MKIKHALYDMKSEFYKSTGKEGMDILKEIFTNYADMIPEYINHSLTIKLHSISTQRANQTVNDLFALTN